MAAQHHLFWLRPDRKVQYYGHGANKDQELSVARLNLRTLTRAKEQLRVGLDLQLQQNPTFARARSERAVIQMRGALHALENGQAVENIALKRVVLGALSHGALPVLKQIRTHVTRFDPLLTPQYRDVVPLINTDMPVRDGLLLHRADPHLYLWTPAKTTHERRLLVCFLTATNTLNTSLPVAHTRLAELGVPILYIYGSPTWHPSRGVAQNWDVAASSHAIRALMARFGFEAFYGLGASLGGYAACLYAKPLGLERVLNFSGSAGHVPGAGDDPLPVSNWADGFDHTRILSIFASHDATDKAILAKYDAAHFMTQRLLLPTDRHGTFTTSWTDGYLPQLLDWLWSGRAVGRAPQNQ
ncbi:hypothetical protein [Celeribacter marinus]|uniref:hypothetical protein n=1 Tax=Celeribacter marinus TaxID=1397108 RepID=UPI003F6A7069